MPKEQNNQTFLFFKNNSSYFYSFLTKLIIALYVFIGLNCNNDPREGKYIISKNPKSDKYIPFPLIILKNITTDPATCFLYGNPDGKAIVDAEIFPGKLTPSDLSIEYDWNGTGNFTSNNTSGGLYPGNKSVVLRLKWKDPLNPNNKVIYSTNTYTYTISTKSDFKNINYLVTKASSASSSDGKIEITPDGTKVPFVYKWKHDPSLSSNIANGLKSDSYEVQVTDALNCTQKYNIIVGDNTIVINPQICYNLSVIKPFLKDEIIWSTYSSSTKPISYYLDKYFLLNPPNGFSIGTLNIGCQAKNISFYGNGSEAALKTTLQMNIDKPSLELINTIQIINPDANSTDININPRGKILAKLIALKLNLLVNEIDIIGNIRYKDFVFLGSPATPSRYNGQKVGDIINLINNQLSCGFLDPVSIIETVLDNLNKGEFIHCQ